MTSFGEKENEEALRAAGMLSTRWTRPRSKSRMQNALRKDLRDRIKQVTGSLTTGSTSDFVTWSYLKRSPLRYVFMRSFS